jgi:hypothetical protein
LHTDRWAAASTTISENINARLRLSGAAVVLGIGIVQQTLKEHARGALEGLPVLRYWI